MFETGLNGRFSPFWRVSWISTFYIASAVVVTSWILTGCRLTPRLGNRVEYPKNPDQISGFYKTEPYSLQYCAQLTAGMSQEQVNAQCHDSSTSKLPSEMVSVMSNPVILYMKNLKTGEALLIHSSGSGDALPILLEEEHKLFFWKRTQGAPVWEDKSCLSHLVLVEDGSLHRYAELVTSASSKFPLSGEIELKIILTTEFQGECANILSEIQGCYLDSNKCGGGSVDENDAIHRTVLSVFSPYVDTGVIKATEINQLKSLSYQVLYK